MNSVKELLLGTENTNRSHKSVERDQLPVEERSSYTVAGFILFGSILSVANRLVFTSS